MKYFVILLALVATAFTALLYMKSDEETLRTVPEQGAGVTLDAVTVPKALPVVRKAEEEPVAPPAAEPVKAEEKLPPPVFVEPVLSTVPVAEAVCLRYGPVERKGLPKLRRKLEKTGVLDRMIMEHADIAQRIVYAGPYSTKKKAAEALETLTAAGLQNGEVMELDGGHYAVRIAQTGIRSLAQRWAREAARAWSLSNVVVEERGGREGFVKLVFPNLTRDENDRIRKVLGEENLASCPD
ncbi:hypothetical protein [Sutterella sp.]|uniref:hypothetical protein n=1 Tax=Sutterella sp. TaxID=1981025 RepID=UPI0026E03B5A|nr:hypothetical protein [Sutterella sp.]MDO5530420.1 hypothetical protein [Sutterella sp.]